jgi:hypothetical protein
MLKLSDSVAGAAGSGRIAGRPGVKAESGDGGTDAADEAAMETRKPDRKVLLAVREGFVDPRLLASARSLCQRMDAELDILVRVAGSALPPDLADFIGGLRADGVAYSLTQKPELRSRVIVQYANRHECISTVVIDSLEGWEVVAADRSTDPWARLACPLVTAAPPKK